MTTIESTLAEQSQESLSSLAGHIAAQLDAGRGRAEVVRELAGQGLAQESAQMVVDEIADALASRWGRHMLYGALWCIGGLLVTLFTYRAASGGGTYVVAWGAVLFGIVDFVRGLVGWSKFKR